MYICIYIYIYVVLYIYMCVCVILYIYICYIIYIYVLYIYIYVCVCVCVCVINMYITQVNKSSLVIVGGWLPIRKKKASLGKVNHTTSSKKGMDTSGPPELRCYLSSWIQEKSWINLVTKTISSMSTQQNPSCISYFFASSHDGAITFSCGLVPCSNDLRVVLNQTRKVDGDSLEDSRIGVLFAGMFVYTYII